MLEDLSSRFEIRTDQYLVWCRDGSMWCTCMWGWNFLLCGQQGILSERMYRNNITLLVFVVCTVDCSEIFIDTPTNFIARAQTCSNYKQHNTIKFLIGIAPNGSISFLTRCWEGRVSNKNLVSNTTFYKLLLPGDVVLADRDFTIEEDMMIYGAKLEIPSFTKGKKQVSLWGVEQSAQLSHVRVHIERGIGALKTSTLF